MNIPRPSHPSPDKMRENWINLNGEWEFSFEKDKFDKVINVPFTWTCPLSGINDPRKGNAFYRKYVRQNKNGNRIFLIFGAVDYYCTLYINGFEAGSHAGGYSVCEFDVTDMWKDDFENEIVLSVCDNDEDYQTYGKQGYGNVRGIWQSVYLEIRPQSYIESFRFTTKTDGTVTIKCSVCADSDYTLSAEFENYSVSVQNSDTLALQIENPNLWTCETPYLYHGKLTLSCNGKTDTVKTYFGIREVSAARFDEKGQKFITLNGKPIYINGVLDQSYNPDGYFTLPTDEECKNEILRMKEAGLNLARIHIKSEEPLKLYYADALGLLIMADIPCFWGEPTFLAKKLFEEQMFECIKRDINHPSIIYWVVFNETWGLMTKTGEDQKEYEKSTQEWVRKCYKAVKKYDPTRLVEDNSACLRDHVQTDVNTWHFYKNGYETLKNEIAYYTDGAYEGSSINFIGQNTCGDVPLLNSECGNYWGIEGNAGDSDISWHYKYMLNQYRLQPKVGGFIFTEFHDVINEFNGFYRIDNTKKLFGYDFFVPDMTVSDLHAQTFVAYDLAPMQTLNGGEEIKVPLVLSCFELDMLKTKFDVCYELAFMRENEFDVILSDSFKCTADKIGPSPAGEVTFTAPNENGLLVLRLYLKKDGKIVSRNFVCFDILKEENYLTILPSDFKNIDFRKTELCQQGEKLNCFESGSICASFDVSKLLANGKKDSIDVIFEASTRKTFTRDRDDYEGPSSGIDLSLMLGGQCPSGANKNTFYMTDTKLDGGNLSVYANGTPVAEIHLPDCPADSSGSLSWQYQADDIHLDEAGSYGYFVKCEIPKDIFKTDSMLNLTLKADNGLSLFGRKSGKYPTGIIIK